VRARGFLGSDVIMKKPWLVFLLCLLSVTAFISDAYANTPVPQSIQTDLGDGLVFYITDSWLENYPETGLYRNGELIYTVDRGTWAVMWGRLFFSDDAMTFLEVFGGGTGGRPFIRVYQNGILAYTHSDQDLFTNVEIAEKTRRDLSEPRSDGSALWPRWYTLVEGDYDRANNSLKLTSIEG